LDLASRTLEAKYATKKKSTKMSCRIMRTIKKVKEFEENVKELITRENGLTVSVAEFVEDQTI